MLGEAKEVLQKAVGLRDLAGDLSGFVRGPLAIGCLSTFAQMLLPGLRRSFVETYADVRITQNEADQLELFSRLRQAKDDLALTYDLSLPRDLVFDPIVEIPPLVALSEGHPLADKSEVTIEELAPHPMVLLDLPLSTDYFLSFFTRVGLHANVAERTRDMAVMRSLVANGFGYSIVNARPIKDIAPDGTPMKFVPLVGTNTKLRLGLLTTRGVKGTRLHNAFVQHAKAWVREQSAVTFGTHTA